MEIEVKGEHGILTIVGPRELTVAEIKRICLQLRAEGESVLDFAKRQLYGSNPLAPSRA